MVFRYLEATLLIFSIVWGCCYACEVNDVAVYKVKLHMMWTAAAFPSEYPGKLQWSRVFGQSHNRTYALYRIGDVTRPSVHEFLQFGTLDPLLEEGEEEPKVYDQFMTPAVQDREGETEGIVFLDGGHSLVSLISKMLPSKGRFIGVDSIDLCLHSSWVDQITLDLEPLDAGNENENAKSAEPVEKVPINHDNIAGSEFYNHRPRHNYPIAKVHFTKVKEFSTKEVNNLARKELKSDLKSRINNHRNTVQKIYEFREDSTTKDSLQQLKDLEEDPVGTPRPRNPDNNVVVVTKAPVFGESEEAQSSDLDNMDEVVLAVANGRKLGLGKHLPRHFRSRLHHAVNKKRGKDCIVSAWSDWTPCSDPCGEKSRVRTVVQRKKINGRDCPSLIQKQPCGRCVRGDGDYIW